MEESGIFGDLNPFDATFRRAVQGQDGTTSRKENTHCSSNAEDSLNTPQIYPVLPESSSVVVAAASTGSGAPPTPLKPHVAAKTQLQQLSSNAPQEKQWDQGQPQASPGPSFRSIAPNPKPKPTPEAQLLIRLPGGESVHLSSLPVVKEDDFPVQQPKMAQSAAAAETKARLRDSILLSRPRETEQLPMLLPGSTASSPLKRRHNSGDPVVTKRNELLERNRAAAQRSRNKKKQLNDETKKKMDDLSRANKNLTLENDLLRHEITKLKSILRYHIDCPVTQSLNQTTLISQEMHPKLVTYQVCEKPSEVIIPPKPVEPRVPDEAVAVVPPAASRRPSIADILEQATKAIEDGETESGSNVNVTPASTDHSITSAPAAVTTRTEGMMSVKQKIKSHFTENRK